MFLPEFLTPLNSNVSSAGAYCLKDSLPNCPIFFSSMLAAWRLRQGGT